MLLQTRLIFSYRPQKNLLLPSEVEWLITLKKFVIILPIGMVVLYICIDVNIVKPKKNVGQYVSVPPTIFYDIRKNLTQIFYPIHYIWDRTISFAMF